MPNRTTQTQSVTRAADYERAVAAERRLRPVVAIVDALVELVRPEDRMCSSCVWQKIVKPLIRPLVGWERGYPPEQAKDPTRPGPHGHPWT